MSSPPTIPHDVEVKQNQRQVILRWAIGAFCVFVWEWLLCLPQEYQRIWKQPMNISSFLYLANRYFGLLEFSLIISLKAAAWGPASCAHMFYLEPVGALISIVLSQIILGGRVYALYSQSKVVGLVLGLTLLVQIIISGIGVGTISLPKPTGPPGSRPPCGSVKGSFGWLLAFWTMPLFYDGLVFLLTAWKAFEFWKKEINTPLFNVIWRDGLLYFFAIFSMNLINVVIFLTVPNILRVINLTPTLMLEVLLSCRLLLNLRRAHASTTSQSRWYPRLSDNTRVVTNPSQSIPNLNPGGTGDPVLCSTELTMLNSSTVKQDANRRVGMDEKFFDIKVNSGWSDV